MEYPQALQKNDTIKIISPSNGIISSKNIDVLNSAIHFFLDRQFKIEEDLYVRNSMNGMSASGYDRAKEFTKNMKDKHIQAMITCTGGDYLIQILDKIDWNCCRNNIKWIQGQSDITGLIYYITTKYDVATIYSFNIKKYGDLKISHSILENNLLFLQNNPPKQQITLEDCSIINPFDFISGRIIGGCLDSLKDMIGTKFDCTKSFIEKYKDDGIIWYFDIANMTNEDILRTMWQFENAGWFNYCKGILFGKLLEEITYTNMDLKKLLLDSLSNLNIPILYNMDFGHKNPFLTFVNGSLIKVIYHKNIMIETYYI